MQNQIERETLIEAPAEVVWAVITEPEHLNRWWTDEAELELRPGGEGRFAWHRFDAEADLRVERVERPRLLAYRWSHPKGAEPTPANSMLVEFTLTEEGERTRLRVVESGFDRVEWDEARKAEYARDHESGWRRHLADLVVYVAERQPAAAS